MFKFLIFIVTFILGVLQTQIVINGIVPDFLLIFFVFLVFKKIYFPGISIFFIVILKTLSTSSLLRVIFYWMILEIIINRWKRSFIAIHKSASFFLLIGLSVYSFVFWKIDYSFGLNYILALLKYVSLNLVFFVPFYFLIPEIYSLQEEK